MWEAGTTDKQGFSANENFDTQKVQKAVDPGFCSSADIWIYSSTLATNLSEGPKSKTIVQSRAANG
jgi:galactitol-specific phosphotransferase system IIB component